jgi:hypothetical protein
MPQFFFSINQFKLLVATLNTVSQRNHNCKNSPKHFRCCIIKGFGTPMKFQYTVTMVSSLWLLVAVSCADLDCDPKNPPSKRPGSYDNPIACSDCSSTLSNFSSRLRLLSSTHPKTCGARDRGHYNPVACPRWMQSCTRACIVKLNTSAF